MSAFPFVSYCPLFIIFLFQSLSSFLSFKCFFFPYFLLLSILFFIVLLLAFFLLLQVYILQTFTGYRLQCTGMHCSVLSTNPQKTEISVTLLIQKHEQGRQFLVNNYTLINCNKRMVLIPLFVPNECSIALRSLV